MVFLLESLFSEIVVFRVMDSAKRQCFHTLVNDFLPIPAKADSVDVVDVASLSADAAFLMCKTPVNVIRNIIDEVQKREAARDIPIKYEVD